MKQDYELHGSVKIWFYRTHTKKHGNDMSHQGGEKEVTSNDYMTEKHT